MRVGILGNCQAQGFADSIGAFCPSLEIELRLLVGVDPLDTTTRAALIDDMRRCDVIFVQVLEIRRPDLKPIITAVLDAHERTLRFPMVAFRGFHPDCGHVRRNGAQVSGAIGPYHSILSCAGWLEGLSPGRTAALFNAFSYAALGYSDLFQQARVVLIEQMACLGYDSAPWFAEGAPPFMHTVNHPTGALLHDLARQALDLAKIPLSHVAVAPPDHLASGPVWPVYPELARRIGLANSTESSNISSWATALVDASYGALETDLQAYGLLDFEGRSQPNGSHIHRARAFIRDFVVTRD